MAPRIAQCYPLQAHQIAASASCALVAYQTNGIVAAIVAMTGQLAFTCEPPNEVNIRESRWLAFSGDTGVLAVSANNRFPWTHPIPAGWHNK